MKCTVSPTAKTETTCQLQQRLLNAFVAARILHLASTTTYLNLTWMFWLIQISGAKVRLHEAPREAPRTAASQAHVERQLEISGAASQVQAAMKLVQAFLLAGNVEPLNVPDV